MNKSGDTGKYQQLTLFALDALQVAPTPTYDPYWDVPPTPSSPPSPPLPTPHSPIPTPYSLKIGDRFRTKINGGLLYTLVAIRDGAPKPYTFQADSDGTKIHCQQWDKQFELLDKTDTQPENIPENITTVLEQTTEGYNPYSTVLEQAATDTQQPAPEQSHWTEEYKVVRYHQEHKYYRYIWMEKRKLHHIHIPGGNVRSPIAQRRKLAIEEAISEGRSPSEIEQMIRAWRIGVSH